MPFKCYVIRVVGGCSCVTWEGHPHTNLISLTTMLKSCCHSPAKLMTKGEKERKRLAPATEKLGEGQSKLINKTRA